MLDTTIPKTAKPNKNVEELIKPKKNKSKVRTFRTRHNSFPWGYTYLHSKSLSNFIKSNLVHYLYLRATGLVKSRWSYRSPTDVSTRGM